MKKIQVFLLSFIMLFSLCLTVHAANISYVNEDGKTVKLTDFRDTKGHWAHDIILKWADFQLITGYDGKFNPNGAIKRGDLCVILDRMLGLKYSSYNLYYDLPNNMYYTEAILKCVAEGYITGTGATTVDPNGFATREQVATIVCRMLNLDTTGYNSVRRFADDSSISSWARPYVYTMRKFGYMNGGNDNKVNPRSNITRAEFVTVMNNIAGTYVPKNSGESTFKMDIASNFMTSKNIEMVNSSVSKDLILTPNSTSLTLRSTDVNNRIYIMGKASILLNNSGANQIYLCNGKSDIAGITNKVNEVYVAKFASESSLDTIPQKVVLEEGTRVSISGVMYENDTNTLKTYYGEDIKADISAEQGYVVGGPRIRDAKIVQNIENQITVKNATIVTGDNKIKEIGVLWVDQEDDQNLIVPNYQNKIGYTKYNKTKIDSQIEFDVGKLSGCRSYRMYIIDDNGLYAYSNTFTFKAYDFDIKLNVYDTVDKKYPEKFDAEIVLSGNNVPKVNSVSLVFDTSDIFDESRRNIGLREYINNDSEYSLETTKYLRYTGTINSEFEYDLATREFTYAPPTYFGYIIKFDDGTIVNRFPILSNVVPAGVSPMKALKTGAASYDNNGNIVIKSNYIKTGHIVPQEVGVVFKVSKSSTVDTPTAGVNGWYKIPAGVSIGVNESSYFNSIISSKTTEGKTFYAAYVMTSEGYWYGDVYSVINNLDGDENGFFIESATIEMVGDTEAYLKMVYDNRTKTITSGCSLDLGILGTYKLSNLEWETAGFELFAKIPNIESNMIYSVPVRVYDLYDNVSNAVIVNLDNKNRNDLYLANKDLVGNYYIYSVESGRSNIGNYNFKSLILKNANKSVKLDTNRFIFVDKSTNVTTEKLVLTFEYCGFVFTRTLNLY